MQGALYQRYEHIDALRAVAALLVLWLHVVQVSKEYLIAEGAIFDFFQATFSTADLGRVGVLLFFAISGFVIPASLSGPRREGTRRFLIRRFFRLYPVFWVAVFASAASLWLLQQPATANAVMANLSMVPRLFGQPFINGVFWTLETELLFYAICLVFFLFRIVDKPAAFAGLIIACLAAHMAWRHAVSLALLAENAPPAQLGPANQLAQSIVGNPRMIWHYHSSYIFLHLSIMSLGALCRFQFDQRLGARWLKIFLAAVIGYWTLWIWPKPIWKWATGQWDWSGSYDALNYTIPIALFVIIIRIRSFAWPPLVYLGTISYSIYLLHLPVLYTAVVVIQGGASAGIALPPSWLLAAGSALMTIAVSALIFRFVEKPAIALGRRLSSPAARNKMSDQLPGTAAST